ncbi:MAG: hypothetical protein ABW044_11145, partial [Cellvibrio sp.]
MTFTLRFINCISFALLLFCFSFTSSLAKAETQVAITEQTATQENVVKEENASQSATDEFSNLIQQLAVGSLSERAETVRKLASLNDSRNTLIIAALEQGKLYADSSTNQVFIKDESENFTNAVSGAAANADLNSIKKIPVNNSLRNQLRSLLSQLNLNSEDEATRLSAVKRLLADGLDESSAPIIEKKLATEKNPDIASAMTIALSLFELKNSDEKIRVSAIDKLRGSLEPEARSALTETSTNDESEAVRNTALAALKSIENTISYYRFTENIFFG